MLQEKPHWLAAALTRLLVRGPETLASLLKLAYFLKRLGFSRLGRPALRLLGLGGLALADEHVEDAPGEFLFEKLRLLAREKNPAWLYFAPCGPNYLYPRVGLATVKALEALRGRGNFLDNGCCGLLCYNYGKVRDARTLAERNIERLEALDATAIADASAPAVILDCSSCAAFLKSYPQLFLEDPSWKARALKFAARIRDAAEVFNAGDKVSSITKDRTTYHESCRACHGQGLKPPRELLRAACGESFVELPESDVCCGGAGAFSFVHPELSDEVLRRKIANIAAVRARVVVTSSTSCLTQLAHGLKKYYPDGRVMHISELTAQAVCKEAPCGATPGS